MRRQETWALCTALNSLAAPEDLVASLVKQDRKVVNAATSHADHPSPRMLRAPKNRISSVPAMEIMRYTGGSAAFQTLARTAADSQAASSRS